MPKKAIIVGSGIVGLATARALAEKGWVVTVYEENSQADGASVRNFGMIWPIGQASGIQYERAMRTKAIWKQICVETGYWLDEVGSLHLAKTQMESIAMQEIADKFSGERPIYWLKPEEVLTVSAAPKLEGLYGGLWCKDEAIIEPRIIIRALPIYLQQTLDIKFIFNQRINQVGSGYVLINSRKEECDVVFICTGSELKKLYSNIFQENFINCKLQMMRIIQQPHNWRIGPAICGGLSMAHYKSFEAAESIQSLKKELLENYSDYFKYGIHVMVSQNHLGQLTIGDSHEYEDEIEPFDKTYINELILKYLRNLVVFQDWTIVQSWSGIYAKSISMKSEFIQEIEPNVWIVNGFGGAGMTLAWGTIEEWMQGF